MNSFEVIFLVMAPIALIVIMAGMGMSLKLAAFIELAKHPKAALIGLGCQLLLLPCTALLIAIGLELPQTIAAGLVLLAACPGGVPSNAIAFAVKADTVLSVSLTALNSIAIVITMPLILLVSGHVLSMGGIAMVQVPFGELIKQLLILTVLPISVGMAIGHYYPLFATRSEPYVRFFAIIALLLLLGAVAVKEAKFFAENITHVGGIICLFMCSVSAIAYAMAKLFHLAKPQTLTVIIEVGMQNTFLAIFIATNILKDEQLVLLPSTYGVMSMFVVGLMVFIHHKLA